MADRDYKFTVLPDNLLPYGPLGKENLDVIRLQYDFSCWLDTGEIIQQINFPTISVVPVGAPASNWQQDFPLSTTGSASTTDPPADTYPLTIVEQKILTGGTMVEIEVNAGTPGFEYVVSFLAVGKDSGRRKQTDTLINIDIPVNSAMVGPGGVDPNITPPITLNSSTALPFGFSGLVLWSNSSNLNNQVITLPPNPAAGQEVEIIDVLGTNATYPLSIVGDSNVPVDVSGLTGFSSGIAFDVLQFVWTGVNWHMKVPRFGFLA